MLVEEEVKVAYLFLSENKNISDEEIRVNSTSLTTNKAVKTG